jgi:hypothetical protein
MATRFSGKTLTVQIDRFNKCWSSSSLAVLNPRTRPYMYVLLLLASSYQAVAPEIVP